MINADDDGLDVLELDESLADVEKPPEVPPGLYVGEVQDVQKADSAKGNSYYKIKFVITSQELPAELQDQFEDGAVLFWNRQIVPTQKDRRALFNLKKFVESLGLDANTTRIDPNDWMGCQARLRIRHTKYEGEMRAEIQSVDPVEAAAVPRGAKRPAPVPVNEEDDAPAPRRGAGRAPARGRR